jgi:hypothetical protein
MTTQADEHAATELKLYIDNDAALYKNQRQSINKNLAAKKVTSKYKHDLAVKLFGYLVETGAKKYAKDFDDPKRWHHIFSVPTRKAVAEQLTRDFEDEFENGSFDSLLPKKYQAELAKKNLVPTRPHAPPHPDTYHATKRGHGHLAMHDPKVLRSASDRQVRDFYYDEKHDAARARAEAQRRGLHVHATKKIAWKTPEGMSIAWSPVNQAYLALWGRGRPQDKAVLRTADAEGMHDWLRSTYGDAFGISTRVSKRASSAHARVAKTRLLYVVQGNYGYGHGWEDLTASNVRKEAVADLKAYRENDRSGTFRLINRREKIESDAAGVTAHSRKSKAQLDREIAERIPSWRKGH